MSSEELDAIFERHTRIINDMVERGGVSTKGDILRIKGFVKELEDYQGKKDIIEKYLVRSALKTLNETIEIAEEENIGE